MSDSDTPELDAARLRNERVESALRRIMELLAPLPSERDGAYYAYSLAKTVIEEAEATS